jgi:hypothetical protein
MSDFMDAQYSEKIKECQAKLNRAQRCLKKHTSDLDALKDEIVKAIQGKSKFTPDLLNDAIEKITQEQKQAEIDVTRFADEYSNSERIVLDLKAQHNKLLNWANIFNDSEMEVKKMIIAHLIDRITVSAGNAIEVTFNISVEQFVNYQQATKKAQLVGL